MKRTGKTKSKLYKHVYEVKHGQKSEIGKWIGSIKQRSKKFKKERDAAKWVDLQLIRDGQEPVNILKRV